MASQAIFIVSSSLVVVVVVDSAVVVGRILDNVRLSTAKTLLTNYKGI